MSPGSVTADVTADEIQKQMRKTRRELGVGVSDIVEKARVMTDWKHYVRTNPWLCLGAAGILGYLLVPQKFQLSQSSMEPIIELGKAARDTADATKPSASVSSSIFSLMLGMLGPTLLQGGMALASQQLNSLLQPPPEASTNGKGHSSTYKPDAGS